METNLEEMPIREKIVVATINCIAKEGIHSVTTRSIAKEASVNSAAINYYFGTKEKLLEEALKLTISNFLTDSYDALEKKDQTPYSILQELLFYYLEGAMRYPGITKAHLYNPIVNNDYEGVFVKEFNAFLSRLQNYMEEQLPDKNKKEIKFSLMQMLSAVFFPSLMPNLFNEFSKIDFRNHENRREYVNYLLKHYLR